MFSFDFNKKVFVSQKDKISCTDRIGNIIMRENKCSNHHKIDRYEIYSNTIYMVVILMN